MRKLALFSVLAVPAAAIALKRRYGLTAAEMTDYPLAVEYPTGAPVMLVLDVPFGTLEARPGAELLAAGSITCNVAEWEPAVTVDGGRTRIYQGKERSWGIPPFNMTNDWDLKLGTAAPYGLEVNLGAGTYDLDLSGLPLTGLEINAGAGQTELRLDAANPQPCQRVEINTGAGEVTARGLLHLNAASVEISRGAGEMSLYFDEGTLAQPCKVEISGGVGETRVVVRQAMPVRIQTTTGLGSVQARGFERRDNGYETPSYRDAAVKLDIYASLGVGSLKLEAR